MTVDEIITIITNNYSGVVCKNTYGETSFFYNPDGLLKNGVYFCTIKESDGPNDKASRLERENIFRLSTGITKEMYLKNFNEIPKRPLKGETVNLDYQFDKLNVIMPHPVYAWMSWVCILTPDKLQFDKFREYLDISYEKAVKSYTSKLKKLRKE